MELNDPLTEEELDELDAFLMSDATGEEAMDIAMLDGFLTAMAIGPNALPPSQWLPHVWGGEIVWESTAQAQRMMSLVFRHLNDIVCYLRDQPDSFEPLLYEREHEGRKIVILDEWCSGFVEGMALDEEAWRPLLESEDGDDLLHPILLYGTEAGFEELRKNAEFHDAEHDEIASSLGERILAIMEWWLPTRKAKSTVRHEEPKVGRNELCPCGSGKKFKRCCGGQKVLH